MRLTRPSHVTLVLAALLSFAACTRAPRAASAPALANGEAEARQLAARSALLACLDGALPAGFTVIPGRLRPNERAGLPPVRAERSMQVAPGERFERLWIGARPVPGSDSVRVGVRAESGTYLDSNGGHTLDEPPRGTARQAAAAITAACGHITLAPA